ncbi:MAG: sulfurtransferase TusA family protein [Gammaproteobacteria bacterium]|nr:sulfurtransferase TusA family protein [Gammaproteobacteria bacterium]
MSGISALARPDEVVRYGGLVERFLAGGMDPDQFMSARLQFGVYGQRQEGVQMMRIKIPGGCLSREQLEAVAEVVASCSDHDGAHITTRQDLQVHYIPLAKTPDAMGILADAGLTTREACGNTVRNITADSLAGINPGELVDVRPFVDAAARYFLRHPLTQHLPRKFKISFSGSEADGAQALMHDLGLVACFQDGQFGFRLLAGGGLGHKPRQAVVLEELLPEADLLPAMEAVITVHHTYSDRSKRARSRIKFLVDRFGAEGFREKYQAAFERTRAAFAGRDYPQGDWAVPAQADPGLVGAPRGPFQQKQPGYWIVPLAVPLGTLKLMQINALTAIMTRFELTALRTTQDQNLCLVDVPEAALADLTSALESGGFQWPAEGNDVVACPGTSTCRLGITSSMKVAEMLDGGSGDLRIRVSGCHNGCAQPETGDIGIFGEGKRCFGRLIPHYRLYLGGDGRFGGTLAVRGPSIPSARVIEAIERIKRDWAESGVPLFFDWAQTQGGDWFSSRLEDLSRIDEADLDDLSSDHGEENHFKVLQLGGGECAGAAQEYLASNFAEVAHELGYARIFAQQRKPRDSSDCAVKVLELLADAVLFVNGEQSLSSLPERIQQVVTGLADDLALADALVSLSDRAVQLQAEGGSVTPEKGLAFVDELEGVSQSALAYCKARDAQLVLSSSLLADGGQPVAEAMPVSDITAYACPLHYVKARQALAQVEPGRQLEFMIKTGEPTEQIHESLLHDGHQVRSVEERDGVTHLIVARKSA